MAVPLPALIGALGIGYLATFIRLSGLEIMVILVVGILLFGRRLPEIGRHMAHWLRAA